MFSRLILCCVVSFIFSDVNFSWNGEFSNFYAIRKSNSKVLDIPFYMLNVNSSLQMNNFDVKTSIAAEFHHRYDIDLSFIPHFNFINYLHANNINLKLRELYGTYYFNIGEISFGRKMFTLGSVDENSPIDHFNPYNYY